MRVVLVALATLAVLCQLALAAPLTAEEKRAKYGQYMLDIPDEAALLDKRGELTPAARSAFQKLGKGPEQLGNWSSAISSITGIVKDVAGAWTALAQAFGDHSISIPLKRDCCLGFNHFDATTSKNVIVGMPHNISVEFVENELEGMLWAMDGNKARLANQILAAKYSQKSNWTQHRMQYTNSGTSRVQFVHIYVNTDLITQERNMIVVSLNATFELAPDTVYYLESKHSWFGLKTSTNIVAKHVPHTITLSDVTALDIFFQIMANGKMAELLSLAFIWPVLTGCTGMQQQASSSSAAAATLNGLEPPHVHRRH